MNPSEILLSEEFAEFSQKVAVLHAAKKEKKEAFKKVYDAFTAETKEIDSQAAKLQAEWEKLVAEKSGKK